ncbi:MAG: phage major capsid protein [Armatimonadetes bacterium]|nr:phage major capsid protein [Armatimonadota bacterium]
MPSANSTFTEMVTTTLRDHTTIVADNVSTHNALYNRLKRKGRISIKDGGYEIVKPLDYAENATYQRYSGYDALNIDASEVMSAAKFDWVQAAVHITASGRELRMNSGRNQLIDLAEARVKNAFRTAANKTSVDIYSDGALANQMGGLAHIIQNAGTGTVGGINSSTYTFWQNKFREMAGSGAWTKSTIRGDMNAIWLSLVRGNDKPDIIVSSHDFFAVYWESVQDLQRYASDDRATTGFQALKFVTADVIFDSNTNFGTTAEKMYFINTDYLELVVHRDANWSRSDEKMSVNQDAVTIPLFWMGNLCCSNRSLQGVLIDAA